MTRTTHRAPLAEPNARDYGAVKAAAERFEEGYGRAIPNGAALPRHEVTYDPPREEEEEPPRRRRRPMYVEPDLVAPRGSGAGIYVLLLLAVGVLVWVFARNLSPGEVVIETRPTTGPRTPYPTTPPSFGGGGGERPPTQEAPGAAEPVDYGITTYNATQEARAAEFAAEEEAPAPIETPLPGEFWTEAEKATFVAVDATATAQAWAAAEAQTTAFIQDIPTPAPEVVEAMDAQCADAALVAKSPLLQLWCPSIIAEGE